MIPVINDIICKYRSNPKNSYYLNLEIMFRSKNTKHTGKEGTGQIEKMVFLIIASLSYFADHSPASVLVGMWSRERTKGRSALPRNIQNRIDTTSLF